MLSPHVYIAIRQVIVLLFRMIGVISDSWCHHLWWHGTLTRIKMIFSMFTWKLPDIFFKISAEVVITGFLGTTNERLWDRRLDADHLLGHRRVGGRADPRCHGWGFWPYIGAPIGVHAWITCHQHFIITYFIIDIKSNTIALFIVVIEVLWLHVTES